MADIFKGLWNRVGLIAKLAQEIESKSPQFGKTALMKMIYILQEVYGVSCGYNFSLYTYGPYCTDVLADLDYSETLQGVKVLNILSGGYEIVPAAKADLFIEKASEFLSCNKSYIDEAVALFGDMSAKELELQSTIIYIYRNYVRNKWDLNMNELINDVNELKPYFSHDEIKDAFLHLKKIGILGKLSC